MIADRVVWLEEAAASVMAVGGNAWRGSSAFYNGAVVTTNHEAVCRVRFEAMPGSPGEVLIE
jgi:hypothetical protein